MMGTWEWDLDSNHVRWSDSLERVHGLPPGTFDGTFASYEREIFADDHPRVMASAPLAASPTISKRPLRSSTRRTRSRMSAWSSARTTRNRWSIVGTVPRDRHGNDLSRLSERPMRKRLRG